MVTEVKNNIKDIFKIGFLFAASIAGAGFASGKEIMVFFTRYESMGSAGLAFCAITLVVFGYVGLKLTINVRAASLNEFLEKTLGKYAFLFRCIIVSFMFIVFCVMLCGAGELIHIHTGVNYYISSLFFLIFIIWATGNESEFIQKVSIILMGILFISIIIFSVLINIKNSNYRHIEVFSQIDENYGVLFIIWEALTYCGYNVLLVTSSLVGIARGIKKTNIILPGSIAGAITFILPAFIMNSTMVSYVHLIEQEDFPFIFLIELINRNLSLFYSFIVFLAMTLSAMINGYFLRKINIFIPVCGYLLVFTGFSEMIKRIYPIFGLAGLIFLITLITRYVILAEVKHQKNFHQQY